ncbi:MAG: OprD family outer membrane porin [Sulfurovaceae bacterium]|nr:OprD family outer membrane porin [Sulfurovaceae bacterium]
MKKISTVTALFLTLATFSNADTIAEAFKNGKWDGRMRFQYFYTDWEDASKDSANGKAIGGSIIYKTAPFYGFSVGAGLYTTQNAFGLTDPEDGATATTSKDLFCRDIGCVYGDGFTTLAQFYMQYDISRSKIKAGEFLVTNPWITPNDTKMIPIAASGLDIVSNEIPNTTVQFDYINKIKERGESFFGNLTTTGDVPTKIASYYLTHDAPNVAILGAKNKSIDNLELQGWAMYWNDLVAQGQVEANYAFELGDEAIVTLGGRYIKQFDKGAGDIIKPLANNYDSDNSIDTSIIMGRAVVNYGRAKLLLAASKTDDGGDIIAPWRAFPTDGYTRSMTQTDWNAGTKAYKAGFDYDWSDIIIDGITSSLSYSKYNRDETKKPYQSMTDRGYQNGDTDQYNLDIIYKPSKSYEFKLRLMDQKNDKTAYYTADTSNREVRVEANYYF